MILDLLIVLENHAQEETSSHSLPFFFFTLLLGETRSIFITNRFALFERLAYLQFIEMYVWKQIISQRQAYS